jgi:hypothetical protein
MTSASNFKTCPDCAERVRAGARICRFCGYSFETGTSGVAQATPQDTGVDSGTTETIGLAAPDPYMALSGGEADFPPEMAPVGSPGDSGPQGDLELLAPLPDVPSASIMPSNIKWLGLIAMAAACLAAYVIFFYPVSPATFAPTPSPSLGLPSPTTVDRSEIIAQYQAFGDVAQAGYSDASGTYDQLKIGGANAQALITSLQTTRDTLDSIEPAACFAPLYAQLRSINAQTLSDAQALAASGANSSTALEGDMSAWSNFLSKQLTPNRCGA